MSEALAADEKNDSLPSAYKWIYAIIFLTGLALRWAALDARPVHHDESLHLMYGRYFYDWPNVNYYKYSAMLHGPLLYNVLRFVYLTLGSSTWAGRALVALLGSLMMFAPLLFRKYFTRNALLGLTAAIALSPTLIYWSRFIREDNLQLFAMLIMLCGVVLAKGGLKVIVAFMGITLQFCGKENSYVTMALLTGFLLFEFCFNLVFHRSWDSLLVSLLKYLRRYWRESLVALALGALVYCYLYSAGFRYSKGILDGLYRESIIYWMNQHSIERIAGPFLFRFYVLSWYELLFMAALFIQIFIFYKRADYPVKIAGFAMLAAGCLCAALAIKYPQMKDQAPWNSFRLKDPLAPEIFALIVFLVQPVIVTAQHLLRRERALAFWGYLFSASLFTYSYLGEKVPWLTVYPFCAGLIYLALYFQSCFSEDSIRQMSEVPWWKVFSHVGTFFLVVGLLTFIEDTYFRLDGSGNLIVIGLGTIFLLLTLLEVFLKVCGRVDVRILLLAAFFLFNVRAAGLTNFVHAGKPSEFLSQVHTTPEFHDFLLALRREMKTPLDGVAPKVLGIEDSIWPVTWYMADVPAFKFGNAETEAKERQNFDYILKNWKDNDPAPAGFRSIRMGLRGWWVPDYNKMGFQNFLSYALNHTPWNDTGYSYLTVLIKRTEKADGQTQTAEQAP